MRTSPIASALGPSVLFVIAAMLGVGCGDDSTGSDQTPSTLCCDPAEQPGAGDNPTCVEGVRCCADGSWQCNQATGESTCGDFGGECMAGDCDPALEPGTGDNPTCFEGATCCPDGTWQCNDFGGQPTC